jgi:tetratricopeptide (TPR) repeat protein
MKLLNCWVLMTVILVGAGCTNAKRYLERGQKDFDAGKYEDASINFRNAIQQDPRSGEANYKLALTELKLQKVPDAYHHMYQAVALMPDNDEAKVSFANLCLEIYQSDPQRPKSMYDQLAKVISEMAARQPNGYDTMRFKGYLALFDRKLPEGISDLEKANQVKPLEPEVVLPLMQALFQDQRSGEALKLGQETIQKHKDLTTVYSMLYGHYVAANQLEQAESVLKTQIANNPKHAEYVLQLASHYAQLHKDAEADAVVKRMLEHPADFTRTYLLAGAYYARMSNWQQATSLLEEGAKREPKDKVLYEKNLANVLLAQDKKAEAVRLVDTILAEAPTDQEALRLRAALLMDTRKPENIDKALAELQAGIAQSPDDMLSRYSLARAYMLKSDLENANKQLTEVVTRGPRFLPAHLLLAEIALQRRQPQEVLTQVAPILAAQPDDARARLLEVLALSATGRSGEAHNKLNVLIKDQPNYADAQLELGVMNLQEKKLSEAEAIFRKLYDARQALPRSLEGLVQVLVARDRANQALPLLEEEVKRSPQPGNLRLVLARTAAGVGRDAVVEEQLRLAVKEDPKSYDAHAMLGDYYRQKGDLNQAVAIYQKARDLAPKNPSPDVSLALTYAHAGRTAEAIQSYRNALKRQPDNPILLNDMAYFLAENGGNLDEALKMSQLAVQKLSNSPIASDTLGWIYLKKDRPDAAAQIFANLVKKNPQSALFEYHLGAALAAKGDKTGARAALGAALQKKPEKQDEAKIKELLARLG